MQSELLQRARDHLAAERPNDAGQIARSYCRDVDPTDPEAHFILSEAYRATGRWSMAMAEANHAVTLSPRSRQYRQRFQDAIAEIAQHPSPPPLLGRGARELLRRISSRGINGRGSAGGRPAGSIDLYLQMLGPNGSERNAIDIAKILRRAVDTRLWSDAEPDPRLTELDPTIRPAISARALTGETLVIMAVYSKIPDWIAEVRHRRIILRYNIPNILHFLNWLGAAATLPVESVDIQFNSTAMRDALGIDGDISYPPIDIDHFVPRQSPRTVRVIGRLSRDERDKHHPQDAALYGSLLARDFEIRIMGGTCLMGSLSEHDCLKLMPAQSVPARSFLHGLDLFLYRTGSFYEAWGRVVTEAMACGLPVVCHRQGGYAEIIRHGENGFLFDTNEQALALIEALSGNTATLQRVGAGARQTIDALYSPQSREKWVDYYAAPARR